MTINTLSEKEGEVQSRAEGLGQGEGRRGHGSARRKENRMGKGGGMREGECKAENYTFQFLVQGHFPPSSNLLSALHGEFGMLF